MATPTATKDSQPTAPSESTVAALNKIRAQYNIVSTDYSNIFSVQANTKDSYGNYEMLGQSALNLLGDSYAANNKVSWSSALTQTQVATVPSSLWHPVKDTSATTPLRQRFAEAHKLVNACTNGMWANALYSTNRTVGGTAGGSGNFPIYPADMQYMADGPEISASAKDAPGAGYSLALVDMRKAFQDQSIYSDYLNAVVYTLLNTGARVSGKQVAGSYFTGAVLKSFTSEDYQRYLRAARADTSKEIGQAANYFYPLELATAALLSNKTTTRVVVDQQASGLASLISDVYYGKKSYDPDKYFDTEVFPYVLTRMKLSVVGNSNSLVKNAAGALQVIIDLLATEKTQVSGIKASSEIKNLFIVLSGDSHLGKSSGILLPDDQIEGALNQAEQSGLTFSDSSARGKFSSALKTLNSSGFLGTVGFTIGIIRAVYDTMNLEYAIEHGKATPAQIISLAGRYIGVYSGIGNLITFLKKLSPVVRKALLWAGRTLRFDEICPSVWGARGVLAENIEIPGSVELTAMNSAADSLAQNFSESSLEQEGSYINTAFEEEVQAASTSVKGQSAAQVQKVMYGSVDQTTQEIESAAAEAVGEAAAVSKDEASLAAKAFGVSVSFAGILSSALFLASDIVDISETPNPTFTQWLTLASDTFSLAGSAIGVGIACGFLESSAVATAWAPPLAIALGVTGAVLGLASAVITLVNSNASIDAVRTATQNLFNEFQTDGYLHDWGVKIQFLAVYYYNLLDRSKGEDKITRWSPPGVSIFEDESASWQTFLQATGTTADRFNAALDKFRHVPQQVIDGAKANPA